MSKIIGFDADGVLADYIGHIKSYSPWAGTSHEPTRYDLVEAGMFSDKEAFWAEHMKVSKETSKTPLFDKTVPGVISKLRDNGHKVVIITARDKDIAGSETDKFLRRHGIAVDDVIYSDNKTAHGVDSMIDDSPKNVSELFKAGIPVMLRNSSYIGEAKDFNIPVGVSGGVPVAYSAQDYLDFIETISV